MGINSSPFIQQDLRDYSKKSENRPIQNLQGSSKVISNEDVSKSKVKHMINKTQQTASQIKSLFTEMAQAKISNKFTFGGKKLGFSPKSAHVKKNMQRADSKSKIFFLYYLRNT